MTDLHNNFHDYDLIASNSYPPLDRADDFEVGGVRRYCEVTELMSYGNTT